MTRLDALSPPPSAYSDEYTYDVLGNLKSKTGLGTYTYGVTVSSCATGTPASKPHAVAQAGSITFTYDCNGNMLSGGGRIYTWDVENRPASIAHVSGTESYTYDADGERVTKSNGTVTTFYLGGLWEEDSTGATKSYYNFNGQVVALREATGVSYLHGDHLGSIGVVTNQASVVVSRQYFDPWGKLRAGGVGQTSLNYTGQRLDITGLLYYHARMYDPALGRFVSADSVVPGNASGSMKGIALKPLTVDFHEVGFVAQIGLENRGGDEELYTFGPPNPQALNRYSYGLNNPVKNTDPRGHIALSRDEAIALQSKLRGPNGVIAVLENKRNDEKLGVGLILTGLGGLGGGMIAGSGGLAAGGLGSTAGNVLAYLGNVVDKMGFDPNVTLEALTFFKELDNQLDQYLKWSADPTHPERAYSTFNIWTEKHAYRCPGYPCNVARRYTYSVNMSWGGEQRSSMEVGRLYSYLRDWERSVARSYGPQPAR